MKFTFHTDAGHGWLQVPISLLVELGIQDQMSIYSFKKDKDAYLEEDVDAQIFMGAVKKKTGKKPDLKWEHCDRSPIRGYAPYMKG